MDAFNQVTSTYAGRAQMGVSLLHEAMQSMFDNFNIR